jgi:branched-chain amino acid transport system ATP-binding protein
VTPLLETIGLTRRYSGVVAVDGVDFSVAEDGIHALIGPNGAGKTTLFNLISGVVAPSGGSIRFAGADITRVPPDGRARLGMARTFQNIRLFGTMTVLENALTGLQARHTASLAQIVLRTAAARREEVADVARAREALDLVGLAAKAELPAAALAYGDQRRLEIARAMAARPRLLLLDEPAAGMNPTETAALAVLIRRLGQFGATVLLVEHDMGFVMGIADAITVLNFGRRIFDGGPEGARRDPAVIEAYLGHKVAERLAAAAPPRARG